jgi:hypothetical protein
VASLVVRHVEIRAQDLDQERRDGQVRARDSGVRVLSIPRLEVLADEGFYRREHGLSMAAAPDHRERLGMALGTAPCQ